MLTVLMFLIVTFKFREDNVQFTSVRTTVSNLVNGMKLIWFRFIPGVFIIPVTITFLLFILTFGGTSLVLVLYLTAPPFSLSPAEYGAYSSFLNVTSIVSFLLMAFLQRWKPTEWNFMTFGIVSYIGRQLFYAFTTTKGMFLWSYKN